MEKMQVIFGRNYKPISLAIQIRTVCWWSHVGVITPCGQFVIEARGGFGVIKTPIDEFKARYVETLERYVWCDNLDLAFEILESRMGWPYDLKAGIGILFWFGWDDIDAEQCAELVARAMARFSEEFLSGFVPKDILRMSHPNPGELH